MKHGKKYVESAKLIDKTKLYDTAEALDIAVKTATAKFDETVEIHVRLGVDSRLEAQLFFPTAQVKRFALQYLQRATRLMPLWQQVLNMSVLKILWKKFRAALWTLMFVSLLPI